MRKFVLELGQVEKTSIDDGSSVFKIASEPVLWAKTNRIDFQARLYILRRPCMCGSWAGLFQSTTVFGGCHADKVDMRGMTVLEMLASM